MVWVTCEHNGQLILNSLLLAVITSNSFDVDFMFLVEEVHVPVFAQDQNFIFQH